MTGFGKGDLFDIQNEKDAGTKTDGSDDVGDDSVLPDSVGHKFKDDNSHAKDNKVGNECEGVSEIVEFVLNNKKNYSSLPRAS